MKLLALLSIGVVAAAQCRIGGRIIDTNSGAAMPHVRMALLEERNGAMPQQRWTTPDGAFSFDVPCGKYSLAAIYREVRENYGSRNAGTPFGTAIVAAPERDTAHLVFRWRPLGAISGHVTDEWNEPAENALVQLVWEQPQNGERRARTMQWRWTNDLGEYYFGPLPEGTYYVVVTGQPWYAKNVAIGPRGATVPDDEPNAFRPAYYPNASDASSATPLELKPGTELRADVQLRATRGANITVKLDRAPQGEAVSARLFTTGVRGTRSQQAMSWIYGNTGMFANVPPGSYTVEVKREGGAGFIAREHVDVGATDTEVSLKLESWPTVRGTLAWTNAEMARHGNLMIGLLDMETSVTQWSRINADLSFRFDAAPVGKTRVLLSSADGFFLDHIEATGASATGTVLGLNAAAAVQLKVTVSDATGRVKGFVKSGDETLEGKLVVLVPMKEDETLQGFQSDSDGSYDFLHVRTGDYALFAVDDLNFEYAKRERVQPYLANAQRIHVERKATVENDLSLAITK